MSGKALVLAVVAAGTVAVAAAGGFLALRADPTPATSAALNSAAPSVPASTPAPTADTSATRSETMVAIEPVGDRNSSASRTAASAPKPAASKSTTARTPSPTRPVAAEERYAPSAATRTETPAPPPVPDSTPVTTAPPATRPVEPAPTAPPPVELPTVVAPPAPRFEELTIREDSVIGIRLEQSVSSETAKVEDRVSARVTRDVTVDGRTAIPAGAKLEGTVTAVTPGGRFKERARLGLRFHSLVLADGAKLPLQTETIYRDGDSPTGDATAKIGASAVVGAIIGAAIGGKKGAAIGGAAGAAGGTGAVMAGGNKDASIAAGVPLTVRLTAPATVTIEKTER